MPPDAPQMPMPPDADADPDPDADADPDVLLPGVHRSTAECKSTVRP